VLQLAAYTSAIANDGLYQVPYVVRKVVSADGTVVKETTPQARQVAVSADVIEEVKQSIRTVTQPGGTAWSLFRHFPPEIAVGAKTGTAQPGRSGYVKNKDFDGVFIAFAPVDDPQIAFAGVIEFGQGGTVSIGLVAKKVFETYFNVEPKAAAPTAVREIPLTDIPAADGAPQADTQTDGAPWIDTQPDGAPAAEVPETVAPTADNPPEGDSQAGGLADGAPQADGGPPDVFGNRNPAAENGPEEWMSG
jgi:penicillin-binding protein 2